MIVRKSVFSRFLRRLSNVEGRSEETVEQETVTVPDTYEHGRQAVSDEPDQVSCLRQNPE